MFKILAQCFNQKRKFKSNMFAKLNKDFLPKIIKFGEVFIQNETLNLIKQIFLRWIFHLTWNVEYGFKKFWKFF